MNNSRRQFIKKAGLGLSAAYFLPQLLSCENKKMGIDSPFTNLGEQLYSIRDLMATNPTDS